MRKILTIVFTFLMASAAYGEYSQPILNYNGGIAIHSPKQILATCENNQSSIEIFTSGGAMYGLNEGNPRFVPEYRVLLNGKSIRVQLTGKNDNTMSFKKENYDREVDLIVYVYKPGTLSSSNVAVELFEDNWNGLGDLLPKFNQNDCTINL